VITSLALLAYSVIACYFTYLYQTVHKGWGALYPSHRDIWDIFGREWYKCC